VNFRKAALVIVGNLAERPAPIDGETEVCLFCDAHLPWHLTTMPPSGSRPDWIPATTRTAPTRIGAYDQRAHHRLCPWRQARELCGIPLNRIEQHDRQREHIPDDIRVWDFDEEAG
jgi:hypothetical protein